MAYPLIQKVVTFAVLWWCCCGLSHVAPAADLPAAPLDGLERLRDFDAHRSSSAHPDWRDNNEDFRRIPPGETLVMADLRGPGVISHIWNTVSAPERGYSRLLVLRMYWDGEEHPSVQCPLGDFFAAGHGVDAPVDSVPVRVTSAGRARNCYWRMPFRRSARVTLTNEGDQPAGVYFYVDWQKHDKLPDDAAYFHAQYRQEYPAAAGRNYLVADLAGRGHYIGTVLSVRHRAPEWWGEGDDLFFIDGEAEPRLRGTGTEDYFCDAWGVFKNSGPYYGTPIWSGNEADDALTTVYRWHVPDPIPFRKSLRFELEHKGVTFAPDGKIVSHAAERADDFSSVAFWYQTEPHKPFPLLPAGYARLYFGPKDVLEAESLIPKVTASAGDVIRQGLPATSGGAILHWKPQSPDQTIEIPFEIREAGTYDLRLLLVKSWDYGTYAISLDGQDLGQPLDLYAPAIMPHDHRLTTREFRPGYHTLRVANKGKNDQSKGHYFGLDGLVLRKR